MTDHGFPEVHRYGVVNVRVVRQCGAHHTLRHPGTASELDLGQPGIHISLPQEHSSRTTGIRRARSIADRKCRPHGTRLLSPSPQARDHTHQAMLAGL